MATSQQACPVCGEPCHIDQDGPAVRLRSVGAERIAELEGEWRKDPERANGDAEVVASIYEKLDRAADDRTDVTCADLTGLEAFVVRQMVRRLRYMERGQVGLAAAIGFRDADNEALRERIAALEAEAAQAQSGLLMARAWNRVLEEAGRTALLWLPAPDDVPKASPEAKEQLRRIWAAFAPEEGV